MEHWGWWIQPDEQAALRFITERRWLAAAPNAWGTFRVLHDLYLMGLVSQCGRLFHAIGPGDRACAKLPPAQADIFDGSTLTLEQAA